MNKSFTIFDKYSEKENNVTKSLVDLLRHSETRLTELFIRRFLEIEELETNQVGLVKEYSLQVGTKLIDKSGIGFVLGITDEKMNNEKNRLDTFIEKDTIPDAMIRLNNITILIEAKVDNGKIGKQQLRGHVKKFANGEIIKAFIYRSWQLIYMFFDEILIEQEHNFNDLTNFLLNQFLAYSENMGLTYEKTENFIYTYFSNRPKVLASIINIHEYLSEFNDVHFNKPVTDCFGYKIVKKVVEGRNVTTNKFFSSSKYKNGTYILHLQSAVYANELQKKVDSKFNGNKKYNQDAIKEVHINMNLVENFEQIKPYVDIAYQDRKPCN
ncbi:hypothetical protein [Bacillus sp. AFS029533]|uniref:hypothetical protein n=1 Tax=Bacillus sp. AFS029533 TaxID=2033494 RepID=UPI000BFB854F|nr:hypothetical protein [Bacillus sp. AFS029533]PGZ92213.1 hypothetical protein COE53_12680 [Bacillus sp. AFS029533]